MEERAPPTLVDRYGFVRDTPPNEDLLKENARREKWRVMLSAWETFRKRKKRKLKSRIRKGIPDGVRAQVWYAVSNAAELKARYPSELYSAMAQRDDTCPNQDIIEVDLNRTFPRNQMFMQQSGRNTLQRVLRAYSFFDTEVGYCQGMGFIAGVLLIYLEEEKAFWVFVSLLRFYNLKPQFIPGMPDLHRQLFVANKLLKKFMPKTSACLESVKMDLSFVATQWFLTLYSSSLPFETVVRIWDCYLYEGPKIKYRVFLALFKIMKTKLKKLDFEKIAELVKETVASVTPDRLMAVAFEFRLSKKLISKFSTQFDTTDS
mmetsp:Transcript_27126/g.48673  ORF Transcript_27126/g.48673 Transcript_27126/m.48673 type:complete len:318 (+) Transcript_27126:144-1097(+)|eukprot:CAMPEP_0204900446 /NCGR_PEP_ID=MMETSP1397-20131031/2477_1 /ASSEMBLY_ACC=CAM_ASM_000891 /TAXON_ID=49980 /ORGANISM="Climacostomum Climacostomum virens, Strain Stock W-24" /LENGTH=317 /DNA_ID=CAMNT_0052068595 /DNA_START=113 /DNA_END=1066 /DNA_ORIENTATION=+